MALRLGNVYGPRQDPHGEAGVVAIFCGALLAGATPKVFGDGEQTRDYVYVGDVVARSSPPPKPAGAGPYNIGTGIETSVLELGRRIAARRRDDVRARVRAGAPGEVQRISIDPARAGRELGWRPAPWSRASSPSSGHLRGLDRG